MAGTVTAEVNYLKRLPLYKTEKPFQLFIPVDKNSADPRTSNLEFEPREQRFVDIRDNSSAFSLDDHGFQVKQHLTSLEPASFLDRAVVESKYLPEVEQILKSIDGGYDKIVIFDWRVSYALGYTFPKA